MEPNQGGRGVPGLERVQQLTVYIKETDRVEHHPLYMKILQLVKDSGGAGATVLRGVAGYSISSRAIKQAGLADLKQDLPLAVVIVDSAERLQQLLPTITDWVCVNGGLITLQDLEGHHFLHPHSKLDERR